MVKYFLKLERNIEYYKSKVISLLVSAEWLHNRFIIYFMFDVVITRWTYSFLGLLTDGLSPRYVLTVLSKQAIYPLNPPNLQQEKFS
jgi:hypothetical protein